MQKLLQQYHILFTSNSKQNVLLLDLVNGKSREAVSWAQVNKQNSGPTRGEGFGEENTLCVEEEISPTSTLFLSMYVKA